MLGSIEREAQEASPDTALFDEVRLQELPCTLGAGCREFIREKPFDSHHQPILGDANQQSMNVECVLCPEPVATLIVAVSKLNELRDKQCRRSCNPDADPPSVGVGLE